MKKEILNAISNYSTEDPREIIILDYIKDLLNYKINILLDRLTPYKIRVDFDLFIDFPFFQFTIIPQMYYIEKYISKVKDGDNFYAERKVYQLNRFAINFNLPRLRFLTYSCGEKYFYYDDNDIKKIISFFEIGILELLNKIPKDFKEYYLISEKDLRK